MKSLVVNADDFGFTRDVNRGIVEAHANGILTATTLMANGAAFEDAVALARANPSLDVGCHLVLVQGPSLLRRGEMLPQSLSELMRALVSRSIRPYEELRTQVERILDAGLRPIHLDTHKHTHLWPPVLDAVVRLSQEFGIPWVRRPFDLPLDAKGVPWTKRLLSRGFGAMRGRVHAKLASHGCRTTDHFAGFQITGRFRTEELVSLLHQLPDGLTEFMTHPGRCTEELRCSRTRLKESREAELAALTAPEVRAAVQDLGISLVRYRDLC
jgi:hopanoid biosynthesis associated protein HpnK